MTYDDVVQMSSILTTLTETDLVNTNMLKNDNLKTTELKNRIKYHSQTWMLLAKIYFIYEVNVFMHIEFCLTPFMNF